jgi:hypothetical protein
MIITLVFKQDANFFRRKLGKIAENCDHNIDPRRFVKKTPNFVKKHAKNGALLNNIFGNLKKLPIYINMEI